MKKIGSSFWEWIKNISKFLWNHLDRLINVIVLIISIYALKIAIEANNNQVEQFDENSKSSDKLFNVQLKNSRALNDSLVSQIKSLQSITNKQLSITDEQLNLSKQNYSEQILLGRPRITINNMKIIDTINVKTKTSTLKISYDFYNSGYRTALFLSNRTFVIEIDTLIMLVEDSYNPTSLEPAQSVHQTLYPVLRNENLENFYLFIEFSFYDEFTKREINNFYYLHYFNYLEKNDFYICEDAEKKSLRDFINRNLPKQNKPLLKNEN